MIELVDDPIGDNWPDVEKYDIGQILTECYYRICNDCNLLGLVRIRSNSTTTRVYLAPLNWEDTFILGKDLKTLVEMHGVTLIGGKNPKDARATQRILAALGVHLSVTGKVGV